MPIESLNLQVLNVGYARHDGDWNWQHVNSPFTRIYYVTEGGARLHLECAPRTGERGGRVIDLHPRHLYLVPAFTTHSCECRGVFGHYYLHVYEGFRGDTEVAERYDLPTEVVAQGSEEGLMEEMCRRHPEARLPGSDPLSYDNTGKFTDYVRRYARLPLHEKMLLRGATLMLFARFMEHAQERRWTRDERMVEVIGYVHGHICEAIGIEELADVACVTGPYLIRLFRRELGVSPLQYINRKKMERAQWLLLTEDKTVKEIAHMVGFGDHSYFIRLFRKLTGRTPQEYRRLIAN